MILGWAICSEIRWLKKDSVAFVGSRTVSSSMIILTLVIYIQISHHPVDQVCACNRQQNSQSVIAQTICV